METKTLPSPDTRIFANPHAAARGWYWAMASARVPRGQTRPLSFLGLSLSLERQNSGELSVKPASFRVEERFGMIWLHTDRLSADPLPEFPGLDSRALRAEVDREERWSCSPALLLSGGVDVDHFLFVHRGSSEKTGAMRFESERLGPDAICFRNVARIPKDRWSRRVLAWLCGGTLPFEVTYHSASFVFTKTGLPQFPLYSIFAYRPVPGGGTEGANIFLSPVREGIWGRGLAWLARRLTALQVRRSAREDLPVRNRIRFRLGPRALSAPAFREFFRFVEEQPPVELPL